MLRRPRLTLTTLARAERVSAPTGLDHRNTDPTWLITRFHLWIAGQSASGLDWRRALELEPKERWGRRVGGGGLNASVGWRGFWRLKEETRRSTWAGAKGCGSRTRGVRSGLPLAFRSPPRQLVLQGSTARLVSIQCPLLLSAASPNPSPPSGRRPDHPRPGVRWRISSNQGASKHRPTR